MVHGGGA